MPTSGIGRPAARVSCATVLIQPVELGVAGAAVDELDAHGRLAIQRDIASEISAPPMPQTSENTISAP